MTAFALANDHGSDAAVRKLAAEFGFHDPQHRGELARVFDGRGRSLRYLRPSGVSLDDFAELLWSRGITLKRLTQDDAYKLLCMAFDGERSTPSRRRASAAVREIEKAGERAKRNRLRKSICQECGAIGYSSAAVNLEHCGSRMLRVDPTFTEVMQQVAGGSSPAPF